MAPGEGFEVEFQRLHIKFVGGDALSRDLGEFGSVHDHQSHQFALGRQ